MKLSQTNKDIITVIILILLALFMDNIIDF
jgi:hypothetical protein